MTEETTPSPTQKFLINFGRRFNERYARLYRRIHGLVYFVQIGGTISAFTAYTTQHPEFAGWAGLVIATATTLDITIRPSEKAATATAIRNSYLSLSRQARRLTGEEIDDEIARLRAEGATTDLESLRAVAHNDVLTEMGYSTEQVKKHRCQENPFNWFFRLVA
ncbi:hypothetical protein ACMG4M_05215 [Alcanivorax sp. IL3]|uniref:hypothetical protein n=1 Tax=unclassified Alcanivorax TaxID=2638842 RepID=UPI0039C45A9C